eukprot:10729868-Ditylum_brightwellii.AAC.1
MLGHEPPLTYGVRKLRQIGVTLMRPVIMVAIRGEGIGLWLPLVTHVHAYDLFAGYSWRPT